MTDDWFLALLFWRWIDSVAKKPDCSEDTVMVLHRRQAPSLGAIYEVAIEHKNPLF